MKRFLWIAITIVAAATMTHAAPRLVNYQGYLTDTGGAPVPDGNYDLTVRLYTDSLAGSPIWSETPTVAAAGGVFHVILGALNPLHESSFATEPLWLGIAIGVDPEIAPRTKITSVPWALRAAVADTVLNAPSGGGGDGHSLDAADGDPADVVYVDPYGAVGVGTTAPAFPLHFQKDLDNPLVFTIENTSTGTNAGEAFTLLGGPDTWFNISAFDDEHATMSGAVSINNQRPGANIQIRQNNVEHMRIDSLGNVGVGVWNPQYRLDVNGDARFLGFHMPTGSTAGYVLTTDNLGHGTWQPPAAAPDGDWTVSGDDMYAAVSGNVGIGTTLPLRHLHIVGSDTLGTLMVAPSTSVNENSALYLAEDDDGTYGMEWHYNGATNKLELRGRAGATVYGPHLTFDRNSGTPVFSGSGNGAIMLPLDGVSAAEMFNEPGVADTTHSGGSTLFLPGTVHSVASRSISCPSAGYVIAFGGGSVQWSASGLAGDIELAIDSQADTMPDYTFSLRKGTVPAGTYDFPLGIHRLFTIPSAGTYTFHLLGLQDLGNWRIYDRELTLLFVPTAYGLVSAPAIAASSGPDAAAAEAANAARLEREIEELRAQVEALRAAVERD